MRAVNRIVAALIAVVLLAVCVVAVVEIVLAAAGRQPWLVQHPSIAADLAERAWQDTVVRLVSVAVVLLGLLLLLLGVRRSAPSDVALDPGADGVTMTVSRKSLQRYLAGVAAAQPGVDGSSARAGRGRLTVRADTTLRTPGDMQARVTDAVTASVQALRPAAPLKTSVSIRRRDR